MRTSGASLPAVWHGLTVSKSGSTASGLRDSLPLQSSFGLTSRCPAGAVPISCDVLSLERVLAEPGLPLLCVHAVWDCSPRMRGCPGPWMMCSSNRASARRG